MATVLVPLAEGFEELEAITITDLLTRAEIKVITAGLQPGLVKASRGAVIQPDTTLDEALKHDYDMIVLPGGQPGATHLEKDPRIIKLVQQMAANNKYTAAICAAPKVLATAGILANKSATCYPGTFSSNDFDNVTVTDNTVEEAGMVITSRGPGTAMDFTLTLIEKLKGKTVRDKVEAGLVR